VTRIAAVLAAHVPADPREADFLEVMRALTAVPGDALSRRWFTPGHFTASAFVLSPDRASVLLVHHAKLGRWLQPGGHFEPGDQGDVLAAACREVREETGIDGVIAVSAGGLLDVDVHDIPAAGGDPAHRHYDLRVLLASPTWNVVAGSDARAARWVPLGAVAHEDTDESVLRAVRKIPT
jgi:8-oxo-dGTP pyrophosphatase MutT (NUDIX family)